MSTRLYATTCYFRAPFAYPEGSDQQFHVGLFAGSRVVVLISTPDYQFGPRVWLKNRPRWTLSSLRARGASQPLQSRHQLIFSPLPCTCARIVVSGLALSTTEDVLGASRGAVRILLVPLLHRNVSCLTSRGRSLRQKTQDPGKQEWTIIYSTFAGFRSGSQGRRLFR